MDELAGAIEAVEDGPTVEEEWRYAYVESHYDESIGLPLYPKLVDDPVKEELKLTRRLEPNLDGSSIQHVYPELLRAEVQEITRKLSEVCFLDDEVDFAT